MKKKKIKNKKLALESEQSTSKRLSLHCQVQVIEKIRHLEGKDEVNLHILTYGSFTIPCFY